MSVDDRGFSTTELRGTTYTVEQSLVRNEYAAYDENGDVVLRATQKLFKLKEEFPFVDADGDEVCTVKAGGILDVAGNYTIFDAETDERVAVLDNDVSMSQDTWTIRDGQTQAAVARITSRGAVVTLARNRLPFGELIPHKYEITDGDGHRRDSAAAGPERRERLAGSQRLRGNTVTSLRSVPAPTRQDRLRPTGSAAAGRVGTAPLRGCSPGRASSSRGARRRRPTRRGAACRI